MIAIATQARVQSLPAEIEKLFREHSKFIYRTAFRVTGNGEDAEDVLQSLFVRIMHRELPPNFSRNPKAYLEGVSPSGQLMGDSMRVTVQTQQVSQDISLSLVRAGVISGNVRDADGKPVINARVRIVGPPVPGTAGEGPTALTTTTNDLGAYRAFWLLPGEYRVVAEGPRWRTYWFARAATATDGSPVVLREGEEVSNIDIVLRPSADDPVPPNPRR